MFSKVSIFCPWGRVWERCPLPTGGSWEGLSPRPLPRGEHPRLFELKTRKFFWLWPLPRKIFDFWAQKGEFWCILGATYAVELNGNWLGHWAACTDWWVLMMFYLIWNWNVYFWRWWFTTEHTPPVCHRQLLCNACVTYHVNVFIHSLFCSFVVLVILKVRVHLYIGCVLFALT